MNKALLIQVTVYDESTNEVQQRFVRVYDGQYGYEVEAAFEKLGQQMAKIIDPHHEQ